LEVNIILTFEQYIEKEIKLDSEEYGETTKQLENQVKHEILYIYNNHKLWKLAEKLYFDSNYQYGKRELNLLAKHGYSSLVTFRGQGSGARMYYGKYKKKYLQWNYKTSFHSKFNTIFSS